jgi:hypothetical protein
MRTYNYIEEPQNLAMIFNIAENEDVIIKRKDGLRFKLICMKEDNSSPLDVPGITTNISTQEIIDVVRECRTIDKHSE